MPIKWDGALKKPLAVGALSRLAVPGAGGNQPAARGRRHQLPDRRRFYQVDVLGRGDADAGAAPKLVQLLWSRRAAPWGWY